MPAKLLPSSSPPESRPNPDEPQSENPSRPRRRGAPLGNRNAAKYGFYINPSQKKDLKDHEAHEFTGLNDEIVMLRVHIRRLVRAAAEIDDFYVQLDLLRSLCLATDALTRLIRTQLLLSASQQDETSIAIGQALDEVIRELGIE
jgi:hypothetical protein